MPQEPLSGFAISLAVLAAILHGAAFVLYGLRTKFGRSAPKSASWTIWAIAASLNAASFSMMEGPLPALQFITGSGAGILMFAYALYLRKLKKPQTAADWLCLSVCLVSLCMLQWGEPQYANLFMIGVVGVSFIPTWIGAWTEPGKETTGPWLLWTAAYLCTLFSVVEIKGMWTLAVVAPIAYALMHAVVAFFVQLRGGQYIRARPREP